MWYFFDQLNRRQGPINDAQLKALADRGVISPGTLIETDTGRRGTASQISRLFPSGAAKRPGSPAAPEAVTTAFDSSNPFSSGAFDVPGAMKTSFDPNNPFASGAFDMPETMKAVLGSKAPVVSGVINVSGAANTPLDPKTPIASGVINFPGGIDGINITSKTVIADSPDGKTQVRVTIATGSAAGVSIGSFMGTDHWLYRLFYVLLHLGLLAAAYLLLRGPLRHFGEFEPGDVLTIIVRIALLVALRFLLLASLRYGFRYYASLCKGLVSGR
ncbi:MAG: DUF4339 domain-containing protein [Thermoguttaceae bacterium]|nr:DUF4339 domain-containing protein [Thermoguttaceae bacterium]